MSLDTLSYNVVWTLLLDQGPASAGTRLVYIQGPTLATLGTPVPHSTLPLRQSAQPRRTAREESIWP